MKSEERFTLARIYTGKSTRKSIEKTQYNESWTCVGGETVANKRLVVLN